MCTRWQCTKIPSLVNGRCFHSLMSLLVAFCYRSWISKCQTVLQISVTDEKIRVLYKSTVDRCWDVQYCREGSGGNMSDERAQQQHFSSRLGRQKLSFESRWRCCGTSSACQAAHACLHWMITDGCHHPRTYLYAVSKVFLEEKIGSIMDFGGSVSANPYWGTKVWNFPILSCFSCPSLLLA